MKEKFFNFLTEISKGLLDYLVRENLRLTPKSLVEVG